MTPQKSKRQLHTYFQSRIIYIISQRGKSVVTVRKHWTKLGLKFRMINNKWYSYRSDITGLRSLFPSSFAAWNIQLSFWLVTLPVYSSPWQTSHSFGISTMLGSLSQPRIHLHSFIQWPFKSSFLGSWPYCGSPQLTQFLRLNLKPILSQSSSGLLAPESRESPD